jgi:O-antigen biosynthesis protein WbqP
MSIVGPRPALYNQSDLIELRTKLNIHTLRPGLTGWAQINGRDDLSVSQKADFDLYYLSKKSIIFDFKIIISTIIKTIQQKNIHH